MATLFEAYVTNAGKYSEGQLVGETLKFPTTAQEVEALLKRIGVDGVRYQEIFITSFDGDVLGLYDHLSEYENLDELNHLACLLSELTSSELETLEAVLDSGDHCSSVRDIINLTQNLDCYGFYPGVSDEETLGRIYVDDLEMLDVPDQVKPYFDYEAYPNAPYGRCGADERGMAMVSLYPLWKADDYTGQPRRGQDLLCHASCGGLYQPKAFTRYGDP